MTNISLGGVGISYPLVAEIGIKFKIQFSIPNESEIIPVTANVTVCHIHFSDNLFQIGLKFENMSRSYKLVILRFIKKKLAQKKYSLKMVAANNKHK